MLPWCSSQAEAFWVGALLSLLALCPQLVPRHRCCCSLQVQQGTAISTAQPSLTSWLRQSFVVLLCMLPHSLRVWKRWKVLIPMQRAAQLKPPMLSSGARGMLSARAATPEQELCCSPPQLSLPSTLLGDFQLCKTGSGLGGAL